ncbi:TIGR02680 family protein [uncultured Ilyobacter sp.]|uniref:TIGR02680 family protein n=1 Tax=uncultured Ilyobacter sp. TaxID=544433 RepID=UPI0029F512DC|nr:TIGR02680 family protein [uncultured Ilyobacter sp.]
MSRWKIEKYGFFNFWLFDKEEIKTSEGNLLLNGENGSGKSVVLQSFIPLIFDGDLSARNLSTEGDSSRKMDYYISYGDKKEGISYLYSELSRTDSSGNKRYINLIVGMKSRNGALVSKWFLITKDKRVGKDFHIYKPDGNSLIPLDKQNLKRDLKNKIDGYYEFYEKPQEYKVAVNKNVFGFSEVDEFDETLNLIRKLRKPDLKENGSLDPKKIYEILNSSLKVIPENELKGMTDTLENIEAISTEIKSMKARLGVLKRIRDDYEIYKKIVLTKRLKEYFKAQENYQEMNNIYNKNIEKKRIREERLKKSIEKEEKLTSELELKHKELEELEGSEDNTLINMLENAINDIKKLDKKIAFLDKDIETEELRLKKADEKLDSTRREFEKSKSKCLDKIEELEKLKNEIGLEWEIDFYELLSNKRIAQVDILEKKYEEHKNSIDKFMKLITRLDKIETDIANIEKKVEEEKKRLENHHRGKNEIEVLNTNKVDEFLDVFSESYQEMRFDYGDIKNFQGILDELSEDYNGKDEAIELFRKLKEYKKENLSKELIKYDRGIDKLQEEIDDNYKEKSKLELSEDSEIELLSHKKKDRQSLEGISPFYKCIRFKDGIEESLKGKIEKALWEMGLLDALVGSNDIFDKFVKPGIKEPENLTNYLEVEDECREKDNVIRILQSISIREDGDAFISADGKYRNKLINGRVDKWKGIYIGIEARKKLRLSKLEKLRKEIENLEERRDLIKVSRDNTSQRIGVLEDESQKIIDRYLETFRPIYESYQKTLTLLESRERELFDIEKDLTNRKNMKTEIYRDIEVIEKKLNISIKKEMYLKIKFSLERFGQILEIFKSNLETHISYSNRLEDIKSTIDNIKSIQDRYRLERRSSINEKNELLERKKVLEIEVDSKDLANLKERIYSLRESINVEIPNRKYKNALIIGNLQKDIEVLGEKLLADSNLLEKIRIESLVEEKLLKLEVKLDHDVVEGEILDLEGKKAIYNRYKEHENKKEIHYINKINTSLIENGSVLKEYRIEKSEYFYEEIEELMQEEVDNKNMRYIIKGSYQGNKVHLGELYNNLDEIVKINSEVLSDEEGKFFSEMVFNYLYNEVAVQIKESREWVNQIDIIMNNAKTNSGKRYTLDWKPKDLQFGFNGTKLKEHIENIYNPSNKGKESQEALKVFFKKKMIDLKKRAEDNKEYTSSYDIIKEILDYRKWYDFKMKVSEHNDGKSVELTKRKLNSYSGGEKAMAMYIPLFSALYARFKNASSKAPIILGMDEAFSVVDDENISKLFEILESLNINYLLASQKLSGTYHSVQNLAIVHIENLAIRRNLPPEEAFVTLIKYIWNGKKRIRDTRDIEGSLI